MIPQEALLVAAATIGILHMSAPDHWATLLVLGRASRWSRSQTMGVGIMTAAGHVALSVVLGFLIVGLGFVFSQEVTLYLTQGIGIAMLVGGVGYGAFELRRRVDEDYERETQEGLARGQARFGERFRYFAVLGAALSPDLAILPVFLLAAPVGWAFASVTAVVFGAASVLALLLFLSLGMLGLGKVFERIPPKYNDAMVGFVVAGVGAYLLLVG